MDEKKWYASKGIWLGLILAVLGVSGYTVDDEMSGMISKNLDSLIEVATGILMVYMRLRAGSTTVAPVQTPQWVPNGQPPTGTPAAYVPPQGISYDQAQQMQQAMPMMPGYPPPYPPQPGTAQYGQTYGYYPPDALSPAGPANGLYPQPARG